MGYRGETLAGLAPALERGVERFAHRTAGKVGEELRRRVRRHTPVAPKDRVPIRASYSTMEAWIRARGGRKPGTLKDSWQVGEVVVLYGGSRLRVPVFTLDPVAPHVEWDTMPHIIVPKRAPALTIPTRGGMVYAQLVHHPGTRGVHMMATALAEVAVEWRRIAEREWRRETRGFFRRNAV